jgi:lipid-binding SYLF domain-containing protein
MKGLLTAKTITLLLLFLPVSCTWLPVSDRPPSRKDENRIQQAIGEFRQNTQIQPFFEQAVAYAVYPDAVRAATGFGGAYGGGWLFRGEVLTGRTVMLQLSIGASLGVQWYRQIVFFNSEQALQQFQRGGFEFAGQVNVAVGPWGGACTPAFNTDVALFTELKGGLLLELSVGTHRYDYLPIQ